MGLANADVFDANGHNDHREPRVVGFVVPGNGSNSAVPSIVHQECHKFKRRGKIRSEGGWDRLLFERRQLYEVVA